MNRLALLALCASACCPRPWPKTLTPLSGGEIVLRTIADRMGPLRSLSATAKIDAFTREGRLKVREVLVVERSGRLRFETLSPFEQPLSTLVSDGKSFALYDLGKKHFYHGPATPENVSRLLPIRMRGEDIARVLMGDPPRIAHDTIAVEIEKCKTRYRVVLSQRSGAARQVITVDAQRLVPLVSQVLLAGDLVYEIVFDNHRDLEKAPLPRKIRYRAPRDGVDILLLYGEDLSANETYEDEIFRLEIPRGAAVRRLE